MSKRKTPLPFPNSGACIKRYRKARGYSQEKLAELVGVSRNHINNVENGVQMAGIRLLYKLAQVLGITIEDLLIENSHVNDTLKKNLQEYIAHTNENELVLLHEVVKVMLPALGRFQIIDKSNK